MLHIQVNQFVFVNSMNTVLIKIITFNFSSQ